ncbi:unnamed protein product [Arabis nemorensis]|uniref:Uncharacterized protein n=1 Tax=Arabis nemorensis TaxID=586526 RepID=A0A565B048_9BRAS|nr:unnamed protein product [Arabis nemorensis]
MVDSDNENNAPVAAGVTRAEFERMQEHMRQSKRVSSIESQRYDELNEKYNQLLKQNQRSGKEKTYVQNAGVSGSQGFSRQSGVQNPGLQKKFSQRFEKQFMQSLGQNGFQGGFQQKPPFNNFQAPASSQDELKELAIDLEETESEEVRESANEDTTKESLPTRVYAPRVPYHTHPKKSRKDLEDAKCKEMLDGLTVKLNLVDAIQMILSMKRYVKGLVTSKVSTEDDFVKDATGYAKMMDSSQSMGKMVAYTSLDGAVETSSSISSYANC